MLCIGIEGVRLKACQFLLCAKIASAVSGLIDDDEFHAVGSPKGVDDGRLETHDLLEVALQGFDGELDLARLARWHHDGHMTALHRQTFGGVSAGREWVARRDLVVAVIAEEHGEVAAGIVDRELERAVGGRGVLPGIRRVAAAGVLAILVDTDPCVLAHGGILVAHGECATGLEGCGAQREARRRGARHTYGLRNGVFAPVEVHRAVAATDEIGAGGEVGGGELKGRDGLSVANVLGQVFVIDIVEILKEEDAAEDDVREPGVAGYLVLAAVQALDGGLLLDGGRQGNNVCGAIAGKPRGTVYGGRGGDVGLREAAREAVDEHVVEGQTAVADAVGLHGHRGAHGVELHDLISPLVDGLLHLVAVAVVGRIAPQLFVVLSRCAHAATCDDMIDGPWGQLATGIEVMVSGAVDDMFLRRREDGHHFVGHPRVGVASPLLGKHRTVLHADDEAHRGVGIGGSDHTLHPLFLDVGRAVGVHHDEQHGACLIGVVEGCAARDALIVDVAVGGIMTLVEFQLRILEQLVVADAGHDGHVGHHLARFIKMCKLILAHGTGVHLVAHVHEQTYMVLQGCFAIFGVEGALGHAQQPFVVRSLVALVVADHQYAEGLGAVGLRLCAEAANLAHALAGNDLIVINGVGFEPFEARRVPIVVRRYLPCLGRDLKGELVGGSAVAHDSAFDHVVGLPAHLDAVGGRLVEVGRRHGSGRLNGHHRQAYRIERVVAASEIVDVGLRHRHAVHGSRPTFPDAVVPKRTDLLHILAVQRSSRGGQQQQGDGIKQVFLLHHSSLFNKHFLRCSILTLDDVEAWGEWGMRSEE